MERSLKFKTSCIVLTSLFFITQNIFANDIYFINSNETNYEKDKIVCSGDVVVVYGDRIITANEMIYDQKTEDITAKGNVIIKDEKQNVYFLDSLTIKKNFEKGKGENIKIILQDRSRLAAKSCVLKNGKFELENAVYTPCYDCLAFDELTWQAKASRVLLDPDDTIEYNDLIIEFLGKTTFYLPYLSMPNPRIKRKTGFLAPKFSVSNEKGFCILPRYFINISDQQELILKPIITQKLGNVAWAYYGSRFKNGEFDIDASITGTKSAKKDGISDDIIRKIDRSRYRGHLFSSFKYDINDIFKCSANINLTSDAYYLRRFPFLTNTDRVLESRALLEGFDNDNYTLVKTSMFQTRYNNDTPKAFPLIERNFSTNLFDGMFNIDLMFANLLFHKSREARKTAGNISWTKEFIAPYGEIFGLKVLTALKILDVKEQQKSNYDSFFDATPQVSLTWKWPLLISCDALFDNTEMIFTPIAGIIAAGNKHHTDVFEDQFTEINDINFLEGGKSISQYNIDYGSRFCYGAKVSLYNEGKNLLQFVIGRITEITDIQQKNEATGLKNKSSNIVSGINLFLNDQVTFFTKGSYSTKSKNWLRVETGLTASYEKFSVDFLVFNGKQCSYNPFFSLENDNDNNSEEKYKGSMIDISWKVSKKTSLKTGITFGGHNNRLIRQKLGMEYQNECANFNINIERTKYRSGDVKPETSFTFTVVLKNLG